MFLFDTDILSNIVKKNPSGTLLQKLRKTPRELQYTSAINIGEVYYGAHRSDKKNKILSAFETHVFPNLSVVSFDEKSGKVFGRVKALMEKDGLVCSEPDLRIAAIAIRNDLVLVTGNTRHFRRIPGLTIENWLN